MQEATGAPRSGVSKGVVLFVTAMASFLTPFMGSSVNIALPTIGREFSADAFSLSWISTAYLLAAAMFLVPMGRLADIHGRRKVFLAGMIGYTFVSLLCGLATSETMLIVLRALQGTTDALMFATATAIVTSVYPPSERGRALGVTVASVYAGLALGPFIGGLITQSLGWRAIFYFTTALGVLVIVLTLWKMKDEWAEAAGQKMDWPGAALYALTLLAVMNGFRLLPEVSGAVVMAVGVACLAGFVLWENRAANPVLDMGLFRNNVVFGMSNLSALINYAATFALTFLLSLYLQYIKGLDPRTSGLVLLSQPFMMSVFSPLAGRLSDRNGAPGGGFSRDGNEHRRAPPHIVPGRLILVCPHRDGPHALRPGVRAFLIPQHERDHGLRGAEALRRGVRHDERHAPDRPDAEHGDRGDDHRFIRGKGADHP